MLSLGSGLTCILLAHLRSDSHLVLKAILEDGWDNHKHWVLVGVYFLAKTEEGVDLQTVLEVHQNVILDEDVKAEAPEVLG